MKKLLLLFLLCSGSVSAQSAFPEHVALEWKNVMTQYSSFDEIKPVLVNSGARSIFLSRLWPDGMAQLERFNEQKGKWESGKWSTRCGTVKYPDVPIEIKPETEHIVDLYWMASTDQGDKHFVESQSNEARPIEGKYRFFLRYALKPWAMGAGDPGQILSFRSPEFSVLPG
jgi:hypothetical protein